MHVQAVMSAVDEVKSEQKASDEVVMLVKRKQKGPVLFLTQRVRDEVQEMIAANDFSKATAMHFLALQDLLHSKVYGVPDPALTGRGGRAVVGVRMQAQGLLNVLGTEGLLEFVRWAWLEEERTERWRRENHRDGARLGAGRLFSRAKLTDYRISLARRGAKKG